MLLKGEWGYIRNHSQEISNLTTLKLTGNIFVEESTVFSAPRALHGILPNGVLKSENLPHHTLMWGS